MVALLFPTASNSYTTTSLLSARLGMSELGSDLGVIPKTSSKAEMVHALSALVFSFLTP